MDALREHTPLLQSHGGHMTRGHSVAPRGAVMGCSQASYQSLAFFSVLAGGKIMREAQRLELSVLICSQW